LLGGQVLGTRAVGVEEGGGEDFLPDGPLFLSGGHDAPRSEVLLEEAEPLDGSLDFPVVDVSTGAVHVVEFLDGLRRETFFLEGRLGDCFEVRELVLVHLGQNGSLKFVVKLGTVEFGKTLKSGL
jgi:hypothetical protein